MKLHNVPLLLLLAVGTLPALSGCSPAQTASVAASGNLYVPADYTARLSAMNLSEVAVMPSAAPPFIAIAEDSSDAQYAVVFDAEGGMQKIPLPLTYAEIIVRFEQEVGLALASSEDEKPIHLVKIGSAFVWLYDDGQQKITLKLDGTPAAAQP